MKKEGFGRDFGMTTIGGIYFAVRDGLLMPRQDYLAELWVQKFPWPLNIKFGIGRKKTRRIVLVFSSADQQYFRRLGTLVTLRHLFSWWGKSGKTRTNLPRPLSQSAGDSIFS